MTVGIRVREEALTLEIPLVDEVDAALLSAVVD